MIYFLISICCIFCAIIIILCLIISKKKSQIEQMQNTFLKMNSSNIIDIRDRNSYVMGHIPQAINIEEYDLLFNTNKYLNKNSIYYIYCDLGNRSGQLAMKLRKDGYNVINIEGGYHNYLLRK